MKLFTVFMVLIGVQWARAEDAPPSSNAECTFNFDGFKSPLDAHSSQFKSISEVKVDKEHTTLTQSGVLKTGEHLNFSGGGCAHLNESYTYTDFGTLDFQNPRACAAQAIQLLKTTPVTKEDGVKKILIGALKVFMKGPMKTQENGVYSLPCGDASCELNLSHKEKLDINYSFAL